MTYRMYQVPQYKPPQPCLSRQVLSPPTSYTHTTRYFSHRPQKGQVCYPRLINLLYSIVQACFALTNRVSTIVAIPVCPVYSKPKYLNLLVRFRGVPLQVSTWSSRLSSSAVIPPYLCPSSSHSVFLMLTVKKFQAQTSDNVSRIRCSINYWVARNTMSFAKSRLGNSMPATLSARFSGAVR